MHWYQAQPERWLQAAGSSPPVEATTTRTSGSCTTGVISGPGNGRGGLGRRGEETEEAVEVGRRGLVASQMERGLLRQWWAGLALPVAVTPGFPPGAGETHSTVPHRPAGHQAAWF